MTSELRRSFKQKAKAAFALPFRLRRGLDPVTGDDVTGGAMETECGSSEDLLQSATMRSNSFDVAPAGYAVPTFAWFTGLLLPEFEERQATVLSAGEQLDINADVDSTLQTQVITDELGTSCRKKTPVVAMVPKGTLPYVVSHSDTLASIAAQFDTTTSELKKYNRLMSDVIFEGKIMFVPDKNYVPSESSSCSGESRPSSPSINDISQSQVPEGLVADDEKHVDPLRMLKLAGYPDMLLMRMKPIFSSGTGQSASKKLNDEEYWHEQFFKLNVTHIIDQHQISSVVHGVLMVTPQAVMFEPTAGTGDSVSGSVDETAGDDLQQHRMIVPLDIVTSITISDQVSCTRTMENSSSRETIDEDVFCPKTNADQALKNPSTQQAYQDDEVPINRNSTVFDDEVDSSCGLCNVAGTSDNEPLGTTFDGFETEEKQLEASRAVQLVMASSPPAGGSMMLSARRLPKAAVALLRFPYDSIRRELDSTGGEDSSPTPQETHSPVQLSSSPSSSAAATDGSSQHGGLVSRTLGSISSLPSSLVDLSSSLFVRGPSGDSGGPSPPRSALLEKTSAASAVTGEKSPGPTTQSSTRTFLFQPLERLVRGTKQGTSDVSEVVDSSANDGSDSLAPVTPIPKKQDTEPMKQEECSPLYMCIKVGKRFTIAPGPNDTFVRIRLKPEYWFIIPPESAEKNEEDTDAICVTQCRDLLHHAFHLTDLNFVSPEAGIHKVDEMYEFFVHWCPHIPETDDEVGLADRGFIAMETSPSGVNEELSTPGCTRQSSKKWQFVNVKEVRRLVSMAEMKNLPLPELSTPSQILSKRNIRQLCYNLPARAEGCPWNLIYSSDKNGFSLNTLYRVMSGFDAPSLIIIHDASNQIFGAMLPCSLKISDAFYGTGESYLFTFYQGFKKYPWTGRNTYFIKGNAESLSFGAGEGVYGLWLDGDLFHGRTQCCLTYDNDLLTSTEDFVVQCLEVWGFS